MKFRIAALTVVILSFFAFANPGEETLYLEVSEIKEKSTIYELINTNAQCQISYFELTKIPKSNSGTDPFTIFNSSSTIEPQIKRVLQESQPGDIFYIEKVKSLADCLQYQGTGKSSFRIVVQ